MLGCRAGAVDLPARTTPGQCPAAGLQHARFIDGSLLRRWLPIALALSGRLARLRERLADHHVDATSDPALIWAAVAVILAPKPDAVLLIRRAERIGDPWSGHMALPGGRRDSLDEDLAATAIREAQEEVGLELRRAHLAGTLEDVIPRTPVLPPIAVRPLVFVLPTRPPLVHNAEVASAQWVRIEHLLQPENYHPVWLDIVGQSREVPAYELADGIVWGMTERILTALLRHLQD
jgi:8-oxo-dGTP pyrophosphatase MutT (NUDIX family)